MAVIALAILILGILLLWGGRGIRQRRGLGQGRTLELDDRNLFSARYGLAGRPDRIFMEDGMRIPEEWKSGDRVYDSYVAQLGTYFVLIEEETGIRPTHGYISLKKDGQHRIENTDELRAWVLGVAEQIRAARRQIHEPIPVRQPPGKCRGCGVREGCGQMAW